MALFDLGKKKEAIEFPDFKFPEEPKLPPLPPTKPFPRFPEFEKKGDGLNTLNIPIRRPPMLQEREVDKRIPLFVKISKYKTVMSNIHSIKEKVQESENILSKLDVIKSEEDKELDSWHENLNEIKERLLEIDEKLFEMD